jgi:hypothetical protein
MGLRSHFLSGSHESSFSTVTVLLGPTEPQKTFRVWKMRGGNP